MTAKSNFTPLTSQGVIKENSWPKNSVNQNPEAEGVIKKILFNKESFQILQLETKQEVITVLGELIQVIPGDEISVWGKWIIHPKYGRQLRLEKFLKKIPSSLEAIEEYLASDLVKGIGPKTAQKIVARFGLSSLEVAQQEPEKLTVIKGITREKAEQIAGCLKQALEFQKVMLELLPLGLTVKMVVKIYRQFGSNTLVKLADNPYVLTEVPQIGFIRADNIARKMEIPFDSLSRLKAGLEFVLQEEAHQNGHLYLDQDYLLVKTREVLQEGDKEIAIEQLATALNFLETEGKIEVEMGENGQQVYLAMFNYWEREAGLAVREKLTGLADKFDVDELADWIEKYDQGTEFTLAGKQKEAVIMACSRRMSMITGGPGTGKTQTVKVIIDTWSRLRKGKKIVLAAPTGRAARRLKEVTGQEAVTIHRLLKLGKGDKLGSYDEGDYVRADLLVVDEFSMVDMYLFYQLMTSVDDKTTVVFIGDTDQLPSVGPGNVLREMISAGVPSMELTEIFRQAHQSQIVLNAHRCNQGEMLKFNSNQDEFYFIQEEENEFVAGQIVQLVRKMVAQGYSIEDIQVLSPMKKTETGVENLNRLLQETLNPPHPLKEALTAKSNIYRVGDKVMQIVNNYEKEVFNGDVGIVYQVNALEGDSHWLEVLYEERLVKYSEGELDELVLGYAITVHKAQGSEYPVVIMPVTTQHYIMLARNLLYTGITRAKEKVIMLGTLKALQIAIKNNRVIRRNTNLAGRVNLP